MWGAEQALGAVPACPPGLGLVPWPLPSPQPAVPGAAPRWGHSPASRSATQLKPDVGTPELPAGRVRVRRDEDGTVTEVDEESVQRVSSAFPSLGWSREGWRIIPGHDDAPPAITPGWLSPRCPQLV